MLETSLSIYWLLRNVWILTHGAYVTAGPNTNLAKQLSDLAKKNIRILRVRIQILNTDSNFTIISLE